MSLTLEPLSPEQREYKEKTLDQLRLNLPLLEAQLAQESRPDVTAAWQDQLEDIEAHIGRLQKELATNVSLEPVADELCKQAASALTKQKIHLAKKYMSKLETIEPFYPHLERLKQDAETGRVSRRTRSIAQSPTLPTAVGSSRAGGLIINMEPQGVASSEEYLAAEVDAKERGGLARFFQFHIIASCLVVLLILCAMAGVGGFSLLQWLIEGS